MAASREVSISVRIDDNGSDGAFRRLTARFNELGDVSDKAIQEIGKNLSKNLKNAYQSGGDREYMETIRRMAPEFRALQEQIRAGSFNLEDYNRRMSFLSALTKDGINKSEELGKAFRDIADESEKTGSTIREMLGEFGGNVAARFVSFLTDQVRQLGQESLRTSLAVESVVAASSTIKDINTSQVSKELYLLSTEIPQLAEQMGEGLYEIFSSVEASQKQALNLTELYSKGAVAARTETAVFGAAVSGVLNAYKLDLNQAGAISDKFFAIIKNGVVNGRELANGLGLVVQPAKNLGLSFDELGGLIAGVTKEGGQASQNINNLANVLMKMPTKEVTDGLKQMRIESTDANGKFRPMLDVLTDLKTKLDQMNPSVRAAKLQELFPDAQARTGLTTILSQLDFIKNATLENTRAAGTTEEAYKKMSSTASAQLQLFYNSVVAFLARMAEWITQSQTLGSVLSLLGGIFTAMSNHTGTVLILIAALGGLVVAFNAVSIAASVSSIVTYIQGLGGLTAVVGNVLKAMFALQTTFATTGAAATAATGGWIALIGLVAAATVALVSYFSASKEVQSADENRVAQLTQLIDVQKQDIAFLNDQTKSLNDSATARNRYESILKSVAVTDKVIIENIDNETEKRKTLSGILQKQLDLRQEQVRTEAVTAALASTTKLQEALEVESQLAKVSIERKKHQDDLNAGILTYTEVLVDGSTGTYLTKAAIEALDSQAGRLNETHKEAIEVLNQNVAVLASMAIQANQTGLEFLTQNGILSTNTDQQVQLAQKIDQANEAIRRQKQAALEAGKAMMDYANTIQEVKLAQSDVSITNEGVGSLAKQIEYNLQTAQTGGKDYNETLRQLKPQFDQLRNALKSGAKDANDYAERLKLLPEIVRKALDASGKFGQYDPNKKERTSLTTKRSANAIDELLPSRGYGFTTYGRTGNDQFGTRQMIQNIEEIGRAWGKMSNTVIQIGDISRKGGGVFAPHATHRSGDMADIRPFRKDGKMLPTNISDPQYDRETTRQFVLLIKKMLPNANVLFNDPQLIKEGLTKYAKGHGNHLHVNRLGSEKSNELQGFQDYERSLQDQSERFTKDFNDAQTRALIEAARMTRIMPEADTIRDFNRILIEKARRDGQRQPSLEETAAEFKNYNILPGVSNADISARPLSRQDQRFKDLRDSLDISKRQKDLDERRLYLADEINIRAEDYRLGLQEQITETQVEAALLAKRNIAIETSVEFEKQRNAQIREIVDIERDLTVLRVQNANAEFVNERRKLAASREKYSLERQITDLQDELANQGANDDLKIQLAYLQDVVSLRNRELDAVIAINKSELEMSKSMEISNNQIRARVYEHLSQQKSLNDAIADGIIGTFEAAADQAGKALDRLNEKTKGFLSFIIEPAKTIQRNILTNITKNLVDAIFPGFGDELTKTNNPIARPIVDEQQKTNKILERIAGAVGAGKGVSSLGIPGLGGGNGNNGLGTIFGGNAGGGIFNFGGSGNYGTRTGDIVDGAMQIFAGDKGRDNIFSNLKNFFSGKKGGIFGKEGFGNNDGTYGAIGMAANLLGSAIGGKVGGFISGAGSGLAMGASIGTMFMPGIGTAIGAAVGAVAGGLMSLFGGDPKRKKDKNENLPALQKGFTDSFKELQQLAEDLKFLGIDGGGAVTKARELRSQIANGFGISFESKKYKKESQKMIAQKLAEIDRRNDADPTQGGIMQQIEYYAELAKGAENRNKRIVAEFATGVYMDRAFMSQYGDYKRKNGMLPGTFTGKDNIRALLAEGEMVLNPSQIRQVIQNARYSQGDPFKGANIPGYANGVYVSPTPSPSPTPSTAISGSNQPVIVQNNLTLVIEEGMTFDEKTKAYLVSDSGKRVQVDIQKELKKEGRI